MYMRLGFPKRGWDKAAVSYGGRRKEIGYCSSLSPFPDIGSKYLLMRCYQYRGQEGYRWAYYVMAYDGDRFIVVDHQCIQFRIHSHGYTIIVFEPGGSAPSRCNIIIYIDFNQIYRETVTFSSWQWEDYLEHTQQPVAMCSRVECMFTEANVNHLTAEFPTLLRNIVYPERRIIK